MTSAPFDRTSGRAIPPTSASIPVALDALFTRVQQDVDAGRLPSCQIALARDGQVAVWRAFGAAPARVALRDLLRDQGRGRGRGVDPHRRGRARRHRGPSPTIIPEFAPNGKDAITVEQVMLHTSGFPGAPFDPLDWDDRERRLARFSQWRCNWEPGTRYEYHPTSAHWVLAEIIERLHRRRLPHVRPRADPRAARRSPGSQLGVPPDAAGRHQRARRDRRARDARRARGRARHP